MRVVSPQPSVSRYRNGHCSVPTRSFPVLVDDVDQTGVNAGGQAQYAERYDEQVLPQAPVELAETRILPVGHQVDAARQDQAQERQAQRSDQRYDRSQVRHSDRDHH